MHQSIPPALRPPRADPRELAFFFTLDGKFPEVGTLELANPPGWGRKKREKCSVLRQQCNIFY